jgi:hypothetical protein
VLRIGSAFIIGISVNAIGLQPPRKIRTRHNLTSRSSL